MYHYASTPPQVLFKVDHPDWEKFDGQNLYKYGKLSRVIRESTPAMRWLLSTCPNENERKRTLVDIKIIWLEEGQNPCLPFWHTDCTMDMGHESRPEKHYIYISGAGSRTRFLWEPLEVGVDLENIDPNKIREIPEQTWVRYGRQHPHACSPAQFSGWRMLIRVTESDLITYSSRPKGVFEYSR